MNVQDFIWDLGGTLLDNYESSTKAFVHTLKEFGISANHEEVYHALKHSTEYAIAQFASTENGFLRVYKKNEAKELEHPVLFDGASDLLIHIVAEGGRNFLISHRDNHVLELLDKTKIAHLFTEVVTSEQGFQRKPNPESMLYLKEKYQLKKALVIGDRKIDIEAGKAAGFETYLFDSMARLEEFIQIREGKRCQKK